MPQIISARLSETWLKAAVVGSLWASFEIIVGSFLHNLRFPFAGSMLAVASVGLVIAFVQIWKERGLVLRAGLIAALLKSMSPSAIILGPMIGIFSEALILEFFMLLFGRNLLGYISGGAIAVLSALMHKVVSLLVTYGFDLVIIVEQFYLYIIKQLGMTQGRPEVLISAVMMVYILAGIAGALIGYLGGRLAGRKRYSGDAGITPERRSSFFTESDLKGSSPWFLLLHIACIISCLYVLNSFPLLVGLFPSLVYAAFCLYWYRGGMRSFRKPSFWIWFTVITIMAAVFWNGLSKGTLWDMEGLVVGLKMNLRAVVILTGFAGLSMELRNPIIRTVLYHHGFANLYHAVGLAFSVLPGIIEFLPGVSKILSRPVHSLGEIVGKTSGTYVVLEKELSGQAPVIIITGEVQEGKTTFLLELITMLGKKDISMAGFIARGIHEQGERKGYELEDLSGGKSTVYIMNTPSPGWSRHGKYYFSPEGLAFGKQILKRVGKGKTDLIVIDEVGPVEMKGKGWADDIGELLQTSSAAQLWVVRKKLLKKVIRNWHIGDTMIIDIAKDTVEDAASAVGHFMGERKAQDQFVNL